MLLPDTPSSVLFQSKNVKKIPFYKVIRTSGNMAVLKPPWRAIFFCQALIELEFYKCLGIEVSSN